MAGFGAFLQEIDDWCGTQIPGRPPRPPWLREILTAVVVAELAGSLTDSDAGRDLYQIATRLYESVAEQVALNPQPLPPLESPVSAS